MKERPIIFSTEMVRAILDGRKTMTRRIIKGIPLSWLDDSGFTPGFVADPANMLCPYGFPSDTLWVRETFREYRAYDGEFHNEIIEYSADNPEPMPMVDGDGFAMFKKDGTQKFIPWKPSIHMPRSAARLFLRITDIRVERLQKICTHDAVEEGVGPDIDDDLLTPIDRFIELWDSINFKRASWESNPYVWVIAFERIS